MYTETFNNQQQTYEIISCFAFLAGVRKSIFENENTPLKKEYYDKLMQNQDARIIRNLCALRTMIEQNFEDISAQMNIGITNLDNIRNQDVIECISSLSEDGVTIIEANTRLVQYVIKINRLISEKIDKCGVIFPEWVEWKYLKKLFIMPNGDNEQRVKEEGIKYQKMKMLYPYQAYLGYLPNKEQENILYNDLKFLSYIYKFNGDEFKNIGQVIKAECSAREQIEKFLYQSEKSTLFVDCENSDSNKVLGLLKYLEKEELSNRIDKVVLYDDMRSSAQWEILEQCVDISIDYRMTERVIEEKSLVDIQLAVGLCKEHSESNIKSFILMASDSDYCGLISELPEVKFLMLIEHSKCSPAIFEALDSLGTNYCGLDEFYTEGNELLEKAFSNELEEILNRSLDFGNISNALNHVYDRSRENLDDKQRSEFLLKYLHAIKITFDSNGQAMIKLDNKKGEKTC